MHKLKSVLKGAMLYLVVFGIALFVTSCGSKKASFTILFKETGDIKKGSPVFLDEVQIGKVTGVKLKNGNIVVKVQVLDEYKSRIKEKSAFYVLGSGDEAHIQVEILDESSPSLKPGSTVKGSSKSTYLLRKGMEKAKGLLKKGTEKAKEYFTSDEWKNFRDETKKKLDEATKKGKEELKKRLPELKEKAGKFYEQAKEHGPEAAGKAKAYIDSLFKEAERSE